MRADGYWRHTGCLGPGEDLFDEIFSVLAFTADNNSVIAKGRVIHWLPPGFYKLQVQVVVSLIVSDSGVKINPLAAN